MGMLTERQTVEVYSEKGLKKYTRDREMVQNQQTGSRIFPKNNGEKSVKGVKIKNAAIFALYKK